MSRFKKMTPHKVVADIFNYKFLVAGRAKAGKTSLMHGIVKEKFNGDLSKLLLIAFESGYKALDGIYAEDIEKWEDFKQLVTDLVTEKDEISFKILALDTVDIMAKMATAYVLKVQGRKDGKRYTAINDLSYGKGYDLLESEIGEQIMKLDRAGFSIFYLTHDKDKQFETREGLKYDKTIVSLSGRVKELIINSVDFVVFVELGKELEKGKAVDKRYIYFRGDSGLEAGSRFKNVPNRIEYDFKGFVNTVEEAILSEYNGDTNAVEKAKIEQIKAKEEKVKEFAKEESDANKSPKEIIDEITAIIETMDNPSKKAFVAYTMENFNTKDYRKMEDVESLNKALAKLKNIQ